MLFKAHKVFWNKWLIWVALLLAGVIFVFEHRYTAIGIVISCLGVIAYILQNNYFFYISDYELICKGGMFFKRIKLTRITGMRFSRHPFFVFAPFKAMFRIRIRYQDDHGRTCYYTIAPQNREIFIRLLMDKCMHLTITPTSEKPVKN